MPPFMTASRNMGTKAFERAFETFRKNSIVAAAGGYKTAREVFTTTSSNQPLPRDTYAKGKAGLEKAAAQLKSLKVEADSLTKPFPPVRIT